MQVVLRGGLTSSGDFTTHYPEKGDLNDTEMEYEFKQAVLVLCSTLSDDYCNRVGCNNCILNEIGE